MNDDPGLPPRLSPYTTENTNAFLGQPRGKSIIVHSDRLGNALAYDLWKNKRTVKLESSEVDSLHEYELEQRQLPFGGVELVPVKSFGGGS